MTGQQNTQPPHSTSETTAAIKLPSVNSAFVRRTAVAIDQDCQLQPQSRILLAVSGGADSMALLATCAQLATRSNRSYTLVVSYIHHHLRPEADTEQQTVANIAQQFGYDFRPASIHPQEGHHPDQPNNLSARARHLRYQALQNIAQQTHADVIATAHHGSDQLETILLNLLRGTGPEGLAAMPWRTTPQDPTSAVPIIRPLLSQSHQDCLDLCNSINWPYHEDSSNQDQSKRRNLVRAQIIPLLRQITPDIDQRIHRTTDLLNESNNLIKTLTTATFPTPEISTDNDDHDLHQNQTLRYHRAELANLPILILTTGLRTAIHNQTHSLDAITQPMLTQLVTAIKDHQTHPRTFDWPNHQTITLNNQYLELQLEPEQANEKPK